jgi:hypothetical protein
MEKMKEQEAKEAWRNFWRHDHRAYNGEIPYMMAISDFQAALIEALEKEIKENDWDTFKRSYCNGVREAISLVKTVTPKKK